MTKPDWHPKKAFLCVVECGVSVLFTLKCWSLGKLLIKTFIINNWIAWTNRKVYGDCHLKIRTSLCNTTMQDHTMQFEDWKILMKWGRTYFLTHHTLPDIEPLDFLSAKKLLFVQKAISRFFSQKPINFYQSNIDIWMEKGCW